ncbi:MULTISPECIES: hypothetical protein [Amycolatopsis]|uniref:DUF3558 domain-containing protein n=1 Tax=Amycolatopsis bullii TaxID=941987 RepID=A0ABQ3KMZ4_9PSEU|nr:hypothetical protein [Amycolatopsis bullii]GHG37126.1 hypothetical protein GCM10017567_67420 [Amycolatopsis bullii]
MRRLSAVPAVALVVFGAVACGSTTRPASTSPLCSASYEPRELVMSGPMYPPLPTASEAVPAGGRTTDVAAIKKIAATACDLPEPPPDIACTADMGPSFELRFADAQGRTTSLTAAAYGCQFVEGLGTSRIGATPLWAALSAAGLPAPRGR